MPKKKAQQRKRKVVRAKPKAKAKHRQLQLPAVMTGPQVQELLAVSHVTVVNLVAAGKLKHIGKAKQKGGGWLYNRAAVERLAEVYKPQNGRRVDDNALGWLTTVPADDVNFKSRLRSANIATVKAALATRAVKKTVTKRKVLESRLRKLLRLQAG